MVRGMMTFYCTECKVKFEGIDTEYGATMFPTPLKCPHCGGMKTRPDSMLFGWALNLVYRGIWGRKK